MRVGRQETERRARGFNQVAHLPCLVGRQVVHDHYIAPAQMPHEMPADN